MECNVETNVNDVPISEKAFLNVKEAAEYTNIGTNKLVEISNDSSCKFVLFVGKKRLFKRKELVEYLNAQYSI